MSSVEVIHVGALHTQRHEDLVAFVESAPEFYRERDSLIVYDEFFLNLLETNFLDHLKSKHRLASLAMRLHVACNDVCNLDFELNRLSCKAQPHPRQSLDVVFENEDWNLPVRSRNVLERVV